MTDMGFLETFRLKDPEHLVGTTYKPAPTGKGYPKKTRPKGEKFIRGPLPHWWMCRAGQLPGAALHVGLILWHMAFIKNSLAVNLTSASLQEMGVGKNAKHLALKSLEEAGLVKVERVHGKNPTVTILDGDPVQAEAVEPDRSIHKRPKRYTAPIPSQSLQAESPSPAGYDGAMPTYDIGTLADGVKTSASRPKTTLVGPGSIVQLSLPGLG
jgi:hypothetical protein